MPCLVCPKSRSWHEGGLHPQSADERVTHKYVIVWGVDPLFWVPCQFWRGVSNQKCSNYKTYSSTKVFVFHRTPQRILFQFFISWQQADRSESRHLKPQDNLPRFPSHASAAENPRDPSLAVQVARTIWVLEVGSWPFRTAGHRLNFMAGSNMDAFGPFSPVSFFGLGGFGTLLKSNTEQKGDPYANLAELEDLGWMLGQHPDLVLSEPKYAPPNLR